MAVSFLIKCSRIVIYDFFVCFILWFSLKTRFLSPSGSLWRQTHSFTLISINQKNKHVQDIVIVILSAQKHKGNKRYRMLIDIPNTLVKMLFFYTRDQSQDLCLPKGHLCHWVKPLTPKCLFLKKVYQACKKFYGELEEKTQNI